MIFTDGDLGVKTRICVKPREIDIWVSGNILDHGVWEQEEVTAIMKMNWPHTSTSVTDFFVNTWVIKEFDE